MPSDPKSFAASEDAGRRRAPRVAVALEASVTGRSPRSVTVVDLALGGCLVRGDSAFDAGAILDLSLPFEGAPLAVKVRVVETSLDGDSLPESQPRYLAGLKFLSLSAADEMRLRSFLESEGRRRRSADSSPA
jgi:PilZ domain